MGYVLKSQHQAFRFSQSVVVGRQEDCDLVLSDGYPSRRHAELSVDEQGVLVTDLGSTNGTFVNGQKIDSRRLADGDEVTFDQSRFRFEVE